MLSMNTTKEPHADLVVLLQYCASPRAVAWSMTHGSLHTTSVQKISYDDATVREG